MLLRAIISSRPPIFSIGFGAFIAIAFLAVLRADTVILKSGVQIEGNAGKIAEIGENPLKPSGKGPVRVTKIWLMDDELRQVFVSTNNLASPPTSAPPGSVERIVIEQRVARNSPRIGGVGPLIRVTPFDEWGRRIVTMNMPNGPRHVIQGITLVTPTYCKVEGLLGRPSYTWDMRIATSSIPRATLTKILMQQMDENNSADRLRVVRLYIQAERYQDAQTELKEVIRDFPGLKALQKTAKELRQSGSRRLIEEIRLRRDAGQHPLAFAMLEKFPSEGVSGEILLEVRELMDEYKELQSKRKQILDQLEQHVSEIADEAIRAKIEPIRKEIAAQLNFQTLERMADYLRLGDDPDTSPQQKVALAISGWLMGNGAGIDNLAVALDQTEVRNLAGEYLRAKHSHEREEILKKLDTLEGGQPEDLSKIVAHMLPPVRTAAQQDGVPGMLRLSTPGLTGEPDFNYLIQLPPNYDQSRRYPCIVTLNGAGTTPELQIDWWAGSYDEKRKTRYDQATRRGYIVIAPQWAADRQPKYKYSAREHAAVLFSLRDALRRFSIDTDRVFLSGHSMGGDAAWDIGLAHPDLWAGVMPIVATARNYVSRYHPNSRFHLPMYFVCGEKDGNRMELNKMDFNRYLTSHSYDVMVVQYQGRGHEHFHDEIQNLFDWMELQQREFSVKEFNCVSMRPWDNFFWWLEVDEFPETTIVAPTEWPRKGAREAPVGAKLLGKNTIRVTTGARKATVYLSPELVDLEKRVTIKFGSKSQSFQPEPSSQVLLEDVRTRGDRQHPYWVKVKLK